MLASVFGLTTILDDGAGPGSSTREIRTSSSYSSPIVIFARVLPCSRRYVTIARVSTPEIAGYIRSQPLSLFIFFFLILLECGSKEGGGVKISRRRDATYNTLSCAPFGETFHRGPV